MPTEPDRSEVSRLLEAVGQGDPEAARDLLPVVYDELRRLAAQRLAHEKPGQTFEATALVHEAYLRAGRQRPRAPLERTRALLLRRGRGHAADPSRECPAQASVSPWRRPGTGSTWTGSTSPRTRRPNELLALNEALDRLADLEPTVAEVVKLRYFAGLTIEETASILGVSVRTANRHWAYARAWLYQQLSPPDSTAR